MNFFRFAEIVFLRYKSQSFEALCNAAHSAVEASVGKDLC